MCAYFSVHEKSVYTWDDDADDADDENLVKFFIIYKQSRELQRQLQTQHREGTGNYIVDKHNIKVKVKLSL
jgi:hypothetical protein